MPTRTDPKTSRTVATSQSPVAGLRIDPAHGPLQLSETAEAGIDLGSVPNLVAEPGSVREIVVRHADDLQLHLAERLREIERREVELEQFRNHLQLAEQTARGWVEEWDQELKRRDRELQLRSDEVSTRAAALATTEIVTEKELADRKMALDQQAASLELRHAEIAERTARLASEQAALQQAMERIAAQRRQDEELHRSRRQQFESLCQADRAQLERSFAQLARHRQALDERETKLDHREQTLSTTHRKKRATPASPVSLAETERQARVAYDCRVALENRWIAGQLWLRLVRSKMLDDEALAVALANVRAQLAAQFERERDTLEELKIAIARAAAPAIKRSVGERAAKANVRDQRRSMSKSTATNSR